MEEWKKCKKNIKIVSYCNYLSSDGHHGFTVDFATSISGESMDVGGVLSDIYYFANNICNMTTLE